MPCKDCPPSATTPAPAAKTPAPAAKPKYAQPAMVYARVLGPKRTKCPSGHPAFFSGGLFDLATETPQQAAARKIGEKWHKIPPKPDDWEVVFDEDVLPPEQLHPRHVPIPYGRVFILRYVPDAAIYKSEGIDPDKIPIEHKESYYLTKKWKTATQNAGTTPKANGAQGA